MTLKYNGNGYRLCKTVRKYWKNNSITRESAFTQPLLTRNGTLGGTSFAVAASSSYDNTLPAYCAFDSDLSNLWHSAGGMPQYLMFYNPIALKVTKLTWALRSDYNVSGNYDAPSTGIIYGSNDNSTWTQIASFNNTTLSGSFDIDLSLNDAYYKYYKLTITAVINTSRPIAVCKYLGITSVYQDSYSYITAGSSSDYDFYEDVIQRYALRHAS